MSKVIRHFLLVTLKISIPSQDLPAGRQGQKLIADFMGMSAIERIVKHYSKGDRSLITTFGPDVFRRTGNKNYIAGKKHIQT